MNAYQVRQRTAMQSSREIEESDQKTHPHGLCGTHFLRHIRTIFLPFLVLGHDVVFAGDDLPVPHNASQASEAFLQT